MNYANLESQIALTIRALERKQSQTREPAVAEILAKYRRALVGLKNPESADGPERLLNCARGYLETSSDWEQEFLHEMGRTEKMVRALGPD